jgi:hypothetical protein
VGRFAGHQVNPRRALAWLEARNRAFRPKEGVRRVWHGRGLVAECSPEQHVHTPAEIGSPTPGGVRLRHRSRTLLLK